MFFLQQQCGDRIQEAPHRVRSLTRSNYDHLHIVPGFEGSRIQRFPGTEAPVFPSAGSVAGQPYQEGRAAETQTPGRSEKDTTVKRGLLRNGRAVPGIPTEHPAPHGRIRHRKAGKGTSLGVQGCELPHAEKGIKKGQTLRSDLEEAATYSPTGKPQYHRR